jgi:hypothetical protein
MAKEIWEDDDDNEQDDNLVKQLRKVIKDMKAAETAKDAELKELRPKVRNQSVSSILTDLKVNPKIARVIPSDIEANKEAISAWLDEYGDIFGAAPASTDSGSSVESNDDDGDNSTPTVDADQAATWQRIQTAGSQSGATAPDAESAQLAMLQSAANAAKGNSDLYFSYLRGEKPIPTS